MSNQIDIGNISAARRTSVKDEGKSTFSMEKLMTTDIKFLEKKFNSARKEWLYSELSILLDAGVDTKAALELIAEDAKTGKEKKILGQLLKEVINGKNISDVMREFPEFSSYEYHSIEIGEETGQLSEVLKELSAFYAGQVKLKRQIVSVLSYPAIVLFVAFGIVYFMLTTIVPMFKDMFKQVGAELPESTKLIMSLSDKFSRYGLLMIALIAGVFIAFYMQRKKIWFRNFFSLVVLRIPVLGELVLKIYLTRFCQSMKLLLRSKTRLIDAIDLVQKMIDFYPMEIALIQVKEDILKGRALHDSLAAHKIFQGRMVSLIKVAEEVNQSDLIFEKLAKQFSDEVDHKNAIIGKLIEPIFIVVLGFIVGFILISMYLPMFDLNSNIK
ncbi:MAG: type II secretion system F family protein [Bacteroidia bacterium]